MVYYIHIENHKEAKMEQNNCIFTIEVKVIKSNKIVFSSFRFKKKKKKKKKKSTYFTHWTH